MIMEIITITILIIACILCLILWHEFGHAFLAEHLGYKTKMNFNKKGFYIEIDNITEQDMRKVALSGILLGIVPLLLIIFTMPFYVALSLVILYFVGVRNDIQKVLH